MSTEAPLHIWEQHDAEYWRHTWRAGAVRLFASVGSSNDIAAELAAGGAPDFSIVLAEEQTRGRGRAGARWHARAHTSLLFSVLFRVNRHGGTPGTAPVRVGLAVADAIADAALTDARLKWPNDVVLPGHGKVAGILCEGAVGRERGGYVIAGIGINVTQAAAEFVGELRGRACSIFSATGATVQRAPLLCDLLARLRLLAGRVTEPLTKEELRRLAERDLLRGRAVVCDSGAGPPVAGVACGIGPDGALLVEHDGRTIPVFAATVRLAASRAYPGSL